jgi:hypothetical protein
MSPAGAGSAPPAGIQAAAGQVTGKPPPPAPAAAPPAGNDRQTALARLQQQQADEYAAQQKALAASKAQQLAQSSAASDFGGFGLSGASAGIRSQVANNADQNATLTLGKLRGQQEDETGQAINRQAALDALEGSENLDVDGDGYINGKPVGGKIGDGNPDDFAQAQAGSTTAINADGTKSTQAVALDAPIDDAHRQNLGSGYDMSHIKDGTFSKGSKYFASDSTYDYYQDASGAFYRVAR